MHIIIFIYLLIFFLAALYLCEFSSSTSIYVVCSHRVCVCVYLSIRTNWRACGPHLHHKYQWFSQIVQHWLKKSIHCHSMLYRKNQWKNKSKCVIIRRSVLFARYIIIIAVAAAACSSFIELNIYFQDHCFTKIHFLYINSAFACNHYYNYYHCFHHLSVISETLCSK